MLEVEEEIAETSLRLEREAEGEMRELILSERDNLVRLKEALRQEVKAKEEKMKLLARAMAMIAKEKVRSP